MSGECGILLGPTRGPLGFTSWAFCGRQDAFRYPKTRQGGHKTLPVSLRRWQKTCLGRSEDATGRLKTAGES